MNLVEQVNKDGFDLIRMQSRDGSIVMEVNPTRGNIISSLIFKGEEMIYINSENYMSMDRPKCGCPVLFPFFGRNENDQLLIDGKVYHTDIHGVAHTNQWIVKSVDYNDDCAVELYTTSNELTKKAFPFEFRLDAKISLKSNEVVYAMKITNLSKETMPCDLGFHPFFTISHLNDIKFSVDAETAYNVVTKSREKYVDVDRSDVKSSGVILENCKLLRLDDADRKVSITISNKKEFKNFMLWTGNEEKFIVVEPLTSVPNAINDKVNRFNLLSGESIESIWSFKLDSIQ
jgi:Galactose mutarotase and related enzymes